MKIVKLKFTTQYIVASVKSSIELFGELQNKDIPREVVTTFLTERINKNLDLYKNDIDSLQETLSEIRNNEKLKELAKTTVSQLSQSIDNFSDNFQYYLENGYLSFEIVEIKTIKSGDYVVLPSIQWGLASLQALEYQRNQSNLLSDLENSEKSKEIFNKIFTEYMNNHDVFLSELNKTFPTDDDKSELNKFITNTFEQLLISTEIKGNLLYYILNGIKTKCWTLDKFKFS